MRSFRPPGLPSTRFSPAPGRIGLATAGLLLAMASAQADEPHRVWVAGGYSFSDELGGFHITGASGIGTRDNPFVIVEELNSATPVTLTIRAAKPIQPFGQAGIFANGILHMRIDVLNNGGQAWIEFQFELQSVLGEPSGFGDGLSFDQANRTPDAISSSDFADFDREFEPYDRLLFKNGKIDPLKTATFDFLITDYAPKQRFYLVQEPRIPTG